MSFLKRNPNVYCLVKSPSSQWIVEYVLTRKLDFGLVTARIDNPYVMAEAALARAPFRVFTSLLRLDLIADEALRAEARAILAQRQIFTSRAIALTEKAEREGGLAEHDAEVFVAEVLEAFRWHDHAKVSVDLYRRLQGEHRLLADVVSFKGPHINHLTPRTLDIELVQSLMPKHGMVPKAVIEGPPLRNCPILLRQTSFKALEEPVSFRDAHGFCRAGSHTARFGEIEQRGIALTPKGRALYDSLMAEARARVRPALDGSNARRYEAALTQAFKPFPDQWNEIRSQGLGYFRYSVTKRGRDRRGRAGRDFGQWIAEGLVHADPIIYEDFLPVSAAGIFQSNLGNEGQLSLAADPSQTRFEADLGSRVLNEFELYAAMERASIDSCRRELDSTRAAE